VLPIEFRRHHRRPEPLFAASSRARASRTSPEARSLLRSTESRPRATQPSIAATSSVAWDAKRTASRAGRAAARRRCDSERPGSSGISAHRGIGRPSIGALDRSRLACACGAALLGRPGLDAARLIRRADRACLTTRLVCTRLVRAAAHGPHDAVAASIAEVLLRGARLTVAVQDAERAWLATTLSVTRIDRSARSRTTTTCRPEHEHPREEHGQPNPYRAHDGGSRAPHMPRGSSSSPSMLRSACGCSGAARPVTAGLTPGRRARADVGPARESRRRRRANPSATALSGRRRSISTVPPRPAVFGRCARALP